MKRAAIAVLGLAGLAAALVLVARAGLTDVAAALADLGWTGIALICCLQLVGMVLCGLAWKVLVPEAGLATCILARWVRDGVSNVLGILPVLGDVAGARVLALFGAGAEAACASTAVDVAAETLAQAVYSIVGVLPLLGHVPAGEIGRWAAALAAMGLSSVALYAVLRRRSALAMAEACLVRAARLFGLDAAVARLRLADGIAELARNRSRVLASTALHLAAWALGAVQVWAAARVMGIPLSALDALALESLVYAARGAFFMVPWSLGVQEAGFLVVGALLGLDEIFCLALSFALRGRDVLLGLPAVLLWLASEGRSGFERWLTVREAGG